MIRSEYIYMEDICSGNNNLLFFKPEMFHFEQRGGGLDSLKCQKTEVPEKLLPPAARVRYRIKQLNGTAV
jgi:hypothetical protein